MNGLVCLVVCGLVAGVISQQAPEAAETSGSLNIVQSLETMCSDICHLACLKARMFCLPIPSFLGICDILRRHCDAACTESCSILNQWIPECNTFQDNSANSANSADSASSDNSDNSDNSAHSANSANLEADQPQPVDLFRTGAEEWHLAFRGTASIQQSVFEAYLHGSENVEAGCKQTTNVNLPCSSHYRSSILDNWRLIDEVAFVIYQSGVMQKYAIFDGSDTDNLSWFSADKLKSSSWPDLKGQPQFFSISGDEQLQRRFFINNVYNGCENDAGWFVAVDRENPPCQWENGEAFPVFLYATNPTYENWEQGNIAQADAIAVYVKYRKMDQLEFVDLFGSGKLEWRMVFRGTSRIGLSIYEAYFHGSENVDVACKQTNGDIPCYSHYRSPILDDWRNIKEVALVLYKSGTMQKFLRFDGTGTDNVNWYDSTKLTSSSWNDLEGPQHKFSIIGDDTVDRRFYISHNYGGCNADAGWFVVKDGGAYSPCSWEDHPPFPFFLYATGNTFETFVSGQVAEADVFAIFVKF